ncbi:MAG: metalloprotease TldD [Rhodospirillaceae bacterium]|nr:metalloprotease TldD [Rhodospirillaceae bacterium]|tara:strand:+ start:1145 stop:2578 length:1434 start_codon:yes stop_codon:yes gene_type:complete
MNHDSITSKIFFENNGLNQTTAEKFTSDALKNADDGELFLEYHQSESFSFDDGKLKEASYDSSQGFGLRAVADDRTGFAHSSELSESALSRAVETVKTVQKGYHGTLSLPPEPSNHKLYTDINPLSNTSFASKVNTLASIDSYARSLDPRVNQVMISLTGSWQAIKLIRGDASFASDVRPLVRINISIIAKDGSRQETGSHGTGGRMDYSKFLDPTHWKNQVREAWRQAEVKLDSLAAPVGEMPIVLGPGWPGILLHEAVGHGLEGDFNRKKTSAFSDLLGQRVAAPGVTVIDDGTISERRGSITIDDEGTPAGRTILIEDGILRGYLQDRMNARLMKMQPTGNGRRQSYAHQPLPRMTNTFMLGGTESPEEMFKSINRGLYAVNFGGGQVDITSGKFVFSASEAYMIENGKITAPVKGASLIGNGPDVLTKVVSVGNDFKMDPGIGTCGKAGQGVPVGVGLPTIRIDGITVGGTET